MIARWRRHRSRIEVALLVALAMIPPLVSSPGRMPADTKLYLYLDPLRLVSDARWSWDPRQMAGWVPHQSISYLWPSGPWYVLADLARLPDWIAHRLWIGILLASAGCGARWAARHLGLGPTAAMIAAVVYQTSPYVVPYISRTSLMLAPYAALGWLIGLTIRAARRGGWRDPALIALVVATVGAPNATATAMIAPAPVLWLLIAAAQREISWTRAAATTARIAALSLAVSAWWISMLAVQARYGADVLAYSETLEAVSLTASSTEVLRGLGYWLFYIRDAFEYATTASMDYQASTLTMASSLAVPLVGLIGLSGVLGGSWSQRRYAAVLLGVGVVLAVGAFPIYDPSPLMSPLAEAPRSTLALAVRSSTRALPLVAMALALGAGHGVTRLGTILAQRGPRPMAFIGRRGVLAGAMMGLAVVNLPILWTAGFVDPALDRDADVPSAWTEAASYLDSLPPGRRVLQIPGAEFGAFRWGYTVDPPLPGLTNRSVVTRDLLPLGSPAAMDLLYAFDDRIQTGILEPDSIAPIARLLGADVIWLTNDAAFDRFSTARPEPLAALVSSAPGLGTVRSFGEPQVNRTERNTLDTIDLVDSTVGQPLPMVQLVEVLDPVEILRTKTDVVVLAGSGDGVVDAAAAGLIDGHELVLYAGSLEASERPDWLTSADRVIVTDTDRIRAHHWRSSQDVWGYTEDIAGTGGVLRAVDGDQRLPITERDRLAEQTYARQVGAVRATATSYGSLFSYQPEHRPVAAIDGGLDTAWLVGTRTDPVGEVLQLDVATPVDHVELVQSLDPLAGRWIDSVEIRTDTAAPVALALTESSRTPAGQRVDLAPGTRRVEVVITATASVGNEFQHWDPVGFAEIRVPQGPVTETVVIAAPALTETPVTTPLDIIVTRWRVGPHETGREDPEPSISRLVPLGSSRSFDVSISARIAARAPDDILAKLLGLDDAVANRRLTGDPASGAWSAIDANPDTAWRPPLDGSVNATIAIRLAPTSTVSEMTPLTLRQRLDDRTSRITRVALTLDGADLGTFEVPPPDAQGTSTLDLDPAVLQQGSELSLEIVAVEPVITLEPGTAVAVELPTALAEISGATIPVRPVDPNRRVEMGCRDDLIAIDGLGVPVQIVTTLDDVWNDRPVTIRRCGDAAITLGPGPVTLTSAPGLRHGVDIDRILLSSPSQPLEIAPGTPGATLASLDESPIGASSNPNTVEGTQRIEVPRRDRTAITARIGPCPQGCWFVHGEGYNRGWTAQFAGRSLGSGSLADGGFNGWWLEPFDSVSTITLSFGPQRFADLGLIISALAILVCVGLVIRRPRSPRPRSVDGDDHEFETAPRDIIDPGDSQAEVGEDDSASTRPRRVMVTAVVAALGLGVGSGYAIRWDWGAIVTVIALGAVLIRRPHWCGHFAVTAAAVGAVVMLMRMRANRELPGPLWPEQFIDLHRPGLVVVALVMASTISMRPPSRGETS